ncbi:MAG TPA: C-terminal binding protein [Conexibacter sp.]|nr:C-terminal binding protein [Conexibacter sp.]
MSGLRAFITDSDFGDDSIEREALAGACELVRAHARSEDEVIEACAGAHALLVQWAPITERVLRALPELRVVVRYGIGLDNVDLVAAAHLGVTVRNVDDYCLGEVSDHAVAAICAANRRLADYDRAVKGGAWGPDVASAPLPPAEDPVGIAGYGRIGQRVARRLAATGHPIVVWDPPAEALAREHGHAVAQTPVELAAASNHLTLHVPATSETKGLVGDAVLAALGPAGHVVNSARGALVDEEALLRWLDAAPAARASLDVLASEPPTGTSRQLASHPQALVSPHVAYLSSASLPRLRRTAAGYVREALVAEQVTP